MNIYTITGADRATGEDMCFSLEAADRAEAERTAYDRGILVTSCVVTGVVPGPPTHATAHPAVATAAPAPRSLYRLEDALYKRDGRVYLRVDQRSPVVTIAFGIILAWLMLVAIAILLWIVMALGLGLAIGAAAKGLSNAGGGGGTPPARNIGGP